MAANPSAPPGWVLWLVSWTLAIAMFIAYAIGAWGSTAEQLTTTVVLYLILGIGLSVLPFMGSIRIGGMLELQREVVAAKDELRDFRSEVRTTLAQTQTLVSRVSMNVYTGGPRASEIREATERTAQVLSNKEVPISQDERLSLQLDGEDLSLALARTRMRLESRLREVLGKRTQVSQAQGVKFLGLKRLVDEFLRRYPEYGSLSSSFAYVADVCNAAIHGQEVSPAQGQETLELGAKLIALVENAQA